MRLPADTKTKLCSNGSASRIIHGVLIALALWFGSERAIAVGMLNSSSEDVVVDLRQQFLTLQARRDFLQSRLELASLLKSRQEAARNRLLDIARAAALAAEVAEEVKKGDLGQVDALQKLLAAFEKQRDEAALRHRELSLINLQMEARWREAEEAAHLRRDSSLSWSQIVASAIRSLWALTFVAIVALLLWLHEQRREIRQWRRSCAAARKPVTMVLLFLAGLSIFCQGCGTPLLPLTLRSIWEQERIGSLAREEQSIRSAIVNLQSEVTELEATLKSLEEDSNAEAAKPRSVTAAILNSERIQTGYQQRISELSFQAFSLEFETSTFELSSKALVASIEKESREISDFQTQRPSQYRAMKRVEVAALFGIAGLFLVPLHWSIWKHWRQLRKYRRTCPRCLTENQLKPIKNGQKTLKLICEGEVRKGVRCAAEFTPEVQRRTRLCFPTVGIIYSGKTKWIRSLEKQFERDMTDGPAHLSLVTPSNAGKQHTATKADEVPLPIVLRLSDGDILPARGQSLVMLFDYGGEMGMRSVSDEPKKRALFMDGFVLFLDPTRTRPRAAQSGKSLSIDDQIETARRFKEDLRAASEKLRGDRLDMPVAVCISKLDLLVNMNPLGGRALEFLDKLRETQDEPITLDLIQRRSRLCAEYLRQMFDGWNIEQFLQTNFGERFMFFPLTPVNINENELGQTDRNDEVEKRTALPFGVQEPIWWLLHMYGYKVLTTETNRD